jgi:hypothetical protein
VKTYLALAALFAGLVVWFGFLGPRAMSGDTLANLVWLGVTIFVIPPCLWFLLRDWLRGRRDDVIGGPIKPIRPPRKWLLPLLVLLLPLGACGERIEPGHVGIKVSLYGSDRGVENEVLGPGWYWMGFSYKLYEFPTYEVNYTFTQAPPTDDAIRFQSVEGLQLNVDVGLQYQIDPTKVPILFQRYRQGVTEITNVYIRNMIRDAINARASTMTVEDIIGRKKNEFTASVESDVRAILAPIGIEVKNVALISDVRVPASIIEAINAKLAAGQKSLQREAEVQQAKAEALKEIERATGDAKSMDLRGEALRRNPEMLQLEMITKWNGILPQVVGSNASPFVSLAPAPVPAPRPTP